MTLNFPVLVLEVPADVVFEIVDEPDPDGSPFKHDCGMFHFAPGEMVQAIT